MINDITCIIMYYWSLNHQCSSNFTGPPSAPSAWVKDFYAVGDGHPRAVEGAFQNNGSGVCWDILLVNLVNRLGNPGKYCWKTCVWSKMYKMLAMLLVLLESLSGCIVWILLTPLDIVVIHALRELLSASTTARCSFVPAKPNLNKRLGDTSPKNQKDPRTQATVSDPLW